MRVLTALSLVLVIAFLVLQTADARFLRQGHTTVSEGDTVGDLVDKFGEPFYREVVEDKQLVDDRRLIERDIHIWYYRIDPGYGNEETYKVWIVEGVIQKIERIGRLKN